MFIRNHRENVFSKETMALITRSTACRYEQRTGIGDFQEGWGMEV